MKLKELQVFKYTNLGNVTGQMIVVQIQSSQRCQREEFGRNAPRQIIKVEIQKYKVAQVANLRWDPTTEVSPLHSPNPKVG